MRCAHHAHRKRPPTGCPDDCGSCGDGFCDVHTEGSGTCPVDCGSCVQAACLPVTESIAMCPIDCGICDPGVCYHE